jgi:hypothetical protein
LTRGAEDDKVAHMSTAELELKTQNFAKKFDDRQLKRIIGFIEDILDVRTYDRSVAGNFPSKPWEDIRAELDQKFGISD